MLLGEEHFWSKRACVAKNNLKKILSSLSSAPKNYLIKKVK